jgi:hypothetical protein
MERKGPIIDLRELPPSRQIEEYDFRVSEGERNPKDAVMCCFKLGPGILNVIREGKS